MPEGWNYRRVSTPRLHHRLRDPVEEPVFTFKPQKPQSPIWDLYRAEQQHPASQCCAGRQFDESELSMEMRLQWVQEVSGSTGRVPITSYYLARWLQCVQWIWLARYMPVATVLVLVILTVMACWFVAKSQTIRRSIGLSMLGQFFVCFGRRLRAFVNMTARKLDFGHGWPWRLWTGKLHPVVRSLLFAMGLQWASQDTSAQEVSLEASLGHTQTHVMTCLESTCLDVPP